MLGARGAATEAYFEQYVEGDATRATKQMGVFQGGLSCVLGFLWYNYTYTLNVVSSLRAVKL